MHSKSTFTLMIANLFSLASASYAGGEMPWVFNAPAADGYSIALESIEPAPGTPLVRGSEVSISASVTYTLSIADHGLVILVPQDEKNRAIGSGTKQVSQPVSAPSGALVLKQTLTVPLNAKEIRLFIPLVPDGISNTKGEITVRYPVVKK
jgi:hypothetical protein